MEGGGRKNGEGRRERGGGGYHWWLALVIYLAIDHATEHRRFREGIPLLLRIETPRTLGRSLRFPIYLLKCCDYISLLFRSLWPLPILSRRGFLPHNARTLFTNDARGHSDVRLHCHQTRVLHILMRNVAINT